MTAFAPRSARSGSKSGSAMAMTQCASVPPTAPMADGLRSHDLGDGTLPDLDADPAAPRVLDAAPESARPRAAGRDPTAADGARAGKPREPDGTQPAPGRLHRRQERRAR